MARLLWWIAGALVWGAVDAGFAVRDSGAGVTWRLALLTLFLYAAVAVATAAPALALARRRGGRVFALSLVGFGFLFAAGYANVAYLPSILHPVSLAANAAMLALAAAAWAVLARWRVVARLEESATLATLAIAAAIGVALAVAAPAAEEEGRAGTVATAAADATSVVVVVIDSVRADRTSLGGRRDGLMPAFEALVAEGWSFSKAWSQSSWTKPSVGSLFTALYPTSHGATLRTGRLSPAAETLPEAFAAAGYATAVFSANPWISPSFGFDQGVGRFVEAERESFVRWVTIHRLIKMVDKALPGSPARAVLPRLERLFGVSEEHQSNCLRDRRLVEEFAAWLDDAGPGPYFAYLHLMSPHIPYDPPGVDHADFPDAEQVALQRVTHALPPERRQRLIELYDETVRHGDRMLGELVEALRERQLLGRTAIVVTADHGEEFHEHGAWGHGNNLHEETVHVPLVLRAPGLKPRRIEAPVMLADVLPTLASLARIEASSGEGSALASAASETLGDRGVYTELTREGGYEAHALRREDLKWIESKAALGASKESRLYDLAADPGEARDLAASLASAARAAWAEALAAVRERAAERTLASDLATIDEDAAERLRGLGYLE